MCAGGDYGGSIPVNVVAMIMGMLGRSTLNVAGGCIGVIIETMACFVFLYALDERSAGLADVEVVAVMTGNLVDDILLLVWWC